MMPKDILKWLAILVGILTVAAVAGFFMLRAGLGGGGSIITETVSSQTVVEQVRLVGRLELAHFFLKDVFRHKFEDKTKLPSMFESFQRFAPSRTGEVLLVVSGEAIGCIDLAKLDSSAIEVLDTLVRVRLPEPEICTFRIDHQNTQVFDAQFDDSFFNRFTDKQKAEILESAYRKAELQIREAALKQGILLQSTQQARQFLEPLFKRLGFKRVEFVPTKG